MLRLFRKRSEGDTFWTWLAANTARIQSCDKQGFTRMGDEISKAFSSAYPDLVWEISQAGSHPWLFCVSADGRRELFPAVSQAVRAAPDLPGWRVQAFRSRGSLNAVLDLGGRKFGYEDIWCQVAARASGVHVTLCIKGLTPATDRALGRAALVLLDNAVGEYDAVMKITQLSRGPLPANPVRRADFFPLAELPRYLDKIGGERFLS